MDKAHIIDHFRNQLAREVIGQGGSLPRFNPMNISPWLAMSLMQKAIRRGREEFALQAAATLLNQAPGRQPRGVFRPLPLLVGSPMAILGYSSPFRHNIHCIRGTIVTKENRGHKRPRFSRRWCGRRDSNPDRDSTPRDFKSLASTSSATPA